MSIWVQFGANWKDIEAKFAGSLPENRELWIAPASNSEGQFAAKYTVNGITYWDNNNGVNYWFPQAFDDFAALAGNNYKVVLGTAFFDGSNTLEVDVGVQNLAFNKVVGIVFTTDDWSTAQTAFGQFNRTMNSGLEVWKIIAPVGAATEVRLAVFYRVSGSEYWDNNFWRNYKVTPSVSQQWGIVP